MSPTCADLDQMMIIMYPPYERADLSSAVPIDESPTWSATTMVCYNDIVQPGEKLTNQKYEPSSDSIFSRIF